MRKKIFKLLNSTEAYICTRCDETKVTHDDKMTGHIKANKKVVNPTCTKQGYTQYICSNCEASPTHRSRSFWYYPEYP